MSSDTHGDAQRGTLAEAQIPLVQRVGAVLWPSFFAAGVATMVFFANVDPLDLAGISFADVEISRELGYTIGFFMFWACTASSSLFTAMLLRSGNRVGHHGGRSGRP